jgi:hypothetical protein
MRLVESILIRDKIRISSIDSRSLLAKWGLLVDIIDLSKGLLLFWSLLNLSSYTNTTSLLYYSLISKLVNKEGP